MSQLLSQAWPPAIASALILASGGLILLAACHDIVSRTVPNWMSAAIACCGLPAAWADSRLLVSVGLGTVVFMTAAIAWRRGMMGGADVKLLGAISIVLPPGVVSTFVVAMAIAGGLHGAAYLLARQMVRPPKRPRPRNLVARAMRAEQWRISRGGPMPYACAIAAGFLFAMFKGATP